jgi:hypothetical protein
MPKFMAVHTLPEPMESSAVVPIAKKVRANCTFDAYWVGTQVQLNDEGNARAQMKKILYLLLIILSVLPCVVAFEELEALDFTKFKEHDKDDKITVVSPTRVEWNQLDRSRDAGLTKKFEKEYLGDFIITFEFCFTDIEAGNNENRQIIRLIKLISKIGKKKPQPRNSLTFYVEQSDDKDDQGYSVFFEKSDGTNIWVNVGTTFYTGVTYYVKIQRIQDEFYYRFLQTLP